MEMQSAEAEGSASSRWTEQSPPSLPAPLLTTDAAVTAWPATVGFRSFWEWIKRRCDRIKGKEILQGPHESSSPPIRALMDMLDQMTAWVDEVPLQPSSNQRFGNLAFRGYFKIVDERLPSLIKAFPDAPGFLVDQILPLFIQSTPFGQPTRLDYGTGHELAFVLILWCFVASGWAGAGDNEDEEDALVLQVFPRYLELVTLLQMTFRLEPAGSHGVWGLDDYCFFPLALCFTILSELMSTSYLFGSAQLLDDSTSPSQALANALDPSATITDMYTLSLRRITHFKKGAAFSEHSPLLHQLSTFPDWKKPHSGLRKMFMGEIVGKRVVVQSLWIGGLCGGDELEKMVPVVKSRGQIRPDEGWSAGGDVGIKAPWSR